MSLGAENTLTLQKVFVKDDASRIFMRQEMFRIAAILMLLAAPLAAQDKAVLCRIQGEIVNSTVAERVGGADAGSAVKNVQAALPADQARFKPAVPPIVDWVYTLEPSQLTDQVAEAYVAACITQ